MKLGMKAVAATGIALILAGSIAGCSAAKEEEKPAPSASESASASATPSESPSDSATDNSNTPSGEALKPGDKTTGSGVIPFSNYDKKMAEFEHKLVSVEKAPQADVDAIVAKVPQAAGLDIYYLKMSSHYVSGDDLAHSSFSTSFYPVSADGTKTQMISLIGWDNCPSGSIPKNATDPSVEIVNCVAGVAAPGGAAPVGVAWAQNDTDYSFYKGKPALFFLP